MAINAPAANTGGSTMRFNVDIFKGVKALVVGDFMADIYHFGHADRLSPEAPVPVFVQDRMEVRPGGAGNVARQLEALGCEVARNGNACTSLKRRYVIGNYQLFRHDQDCILAPWDHDIVEVQTQVESADVVVLSDYNKGWLSYAMCQAVIKCAKKHGIPVVVDPKLPDWTKFWGAEVMCPNSRELCETKTIAAQYNTRSGPHLWDGYIVEKRAERGLRVHYRFSGDGGYEDVPATTQKVFDVTGAGDIVTAVIAAFAGLNKTVVGAASPAVHAVGEPPFSIVAAARLANLAAGYTVGEIGTAVCPKEKLQELACGLDL